MKKMILPAVALASSMAFADPEITALTVTQNDSRLVTIAYTLSADAVVTLDMTTNGVSIGSENFQKIYDPSVARGGSPVNKIVKAGEHTIFWQPNREWPGYVFKNGEFKVELRAWPLSSPPDYMVVDLETPSNRWFYVTAADIPGGLKTADPTDADAVAALNEETYRTSKLVMRKIPAAGNQWRMGSPENESQYRYTPESGTYPETMHYVTLTEDYYMAIYELTSVQRRKVMGSDNYADIDVNISGWKLTGACPPTATYVRLRGDGTGKSWPTDLHEVDPGCELDAFRKFTGLQIDLATEAQWEYACRAGTSGPLYNDASNPNDIAWCSTTVPVGEERPKVVGLKQPNAWGLYDMLGNQFEWVLDQYGFFTEVSVTNPKGATDNADKRVLKGGGYNSTWQRFCRAAARRDLPPSSKTDGGFGGLVGGVRLCCPAAIPAE